MSERPRDELWDTLTELFGEIRTSTDRGRRNRAVRELREADATPAEIRIAYDWCRASFTIFTEIALCSYFGRAQFEHAKQSTTQPRLTVVRRMAGLE